MRRHTAIRVDLGAFCCLVQPGGHFSIDLIDIVDFEMMHPMLRRRMHNFLPSRGTVSATQRDGQHHFSRGILQVLARQPEIGEATIPSKRDLTLGNPDFAMTDIQQGELDSVKDRQP